MSTIEFETDVSQEVGRRVYERACPVAQLLPVPRDRTTLETRDGWGA